MVKYKRPKKKVWAVILLIFSMIFVILAASVALVGYNYLENQKFKETFYCVSSLKVNNKIRIVQISDLHNCSYGKDNYKIVSRVKKLKPDFSESHFNFKMRITPLLDSFELKVKDVDQIKDTAKIIKEEKSDFKTHLRENLKSGKSFAAARSKRTSFAFSLMATALNPSESELSRAVIVDGPAIITLNSL